MVTNNNGFSDALKQTKQLLKVDNKVTLSVLEEAAEYFAKRLRPRIPVDRSNLRDNLKVVVKKDMVQVVFDGNTWYWHLVEHGHKKPFGRGRVKGRHFVRNTWDAESKRIEQIMTEKIIQRMAG